VYNLESLASAKTCKQLFTTNLLVGRNGFEPLTLCL
jgi:hypothetical protein